ncbi:hypothetical protein ACW9IE_04295, partial [Pseudomonas sp. SDO5561_S422]
LPAAQYLRSASGLLGQSDQDQDQKQEHGGLRADLSVESQIKSQSCSSVGAGLPAMLTTRCIRYTQLMPSQRCGDPTSQLPHLNRARFSF